MPILLPCYIIPRGSHLFRYQFAGQGTTGLNKAQLHDSKEGPKHLMLFCLQHLAKHREVMCSMAMMVDYLFSNQINRYAQDSSGIITIILLQNQLSFLTH